MPPFEPATLDALWPTSLGHRASLVWHQPFPVGRAVHETVGSRLFTQSSGIKYVGVWHGLI